MLHNQWNGLKFLEWYSTFDWDGGFIVHLYQNLHGMLHLRHAELVTQLMMWTRGCTSSYRLLPSATPACTTPFIYDVPIACVTYRMALEPTAATLDWTLVGCQVSSLSPSTLFFLSYLTARLHHSWPHTQRYVCISVQCCSIYNNKKLGTT